jgi:hypothetical protein
MHTKNLPVVTISHCPLSSKFTFSKSTPYTRRCLEIIESARITWGYYSDEYKSCCYEIVDGEEVPKKFPPYSTLKLTSARSIQSWYTEHSDLILTSQKTPEVIKKAVQDARWYARPGIESSITDKEILAIFAICEAFGAIYNIQCGKSEDAIKEKVLSASTFLKLAKTGIEPATQDVKIQNKFIPFPTPSGTQWHEVKITLLDAENVSIKIKNNVVKKHYAEMGFKDNRTSKPSKLWSCFKGLLLSNGEITNYQKTKKAVIEKNISDLRRMLKRYFAIKDDPIPYKKTKASTGYKTVFLIEDKSYHTRDEYEESVRENNKKNIKTYHQ